MPPPVTSVLARRQQQVRQSLDPALDALILTTPANIRYLSNHAGSAGTLVLTGDAVHLLVDFRYTAAVAELQASPYACPALRVWPVPASYDEALLECLNTIGVKIVGFESAHLTVARHQWLIAESPARAPGVTFQSTARVIEAVRVVKDSTEIGSLRDAAGRLSQVVDRALGAVRAGETERAVAAAIEAALRAAGYERPAFETIVASGPNAALPHHHPGARALAAGDLVVLDFGGVLDGYCCDLTRTVSIGAPSPQARQVYDAVHEAQRAAIAAVRPGIDTAAVDAAARSVLDARGLGAAFGHGTGHGLGLDVHEEPRIARPRSDAPAVPLEPGMVFTIEPGAYLPGWGGVRIEDDVLVTATGCELLTTVPRELLAL
ncbi:MAG TPA: Xaa-Pro peptidase family protein [Vicinamibacterales bacterium]|nr:Xaa-Pro peptidase family protein [Vicinamibacterales bacterium]